MRSSFYEFLAALPSTIGTISPWLFALLIVYITYRFNRRKDDRQRQSEANAVAAALYSEILVLLKQMARAGTVAAHIKRGTSLKDFDHLYSEENPISEPTLFNALAAKLGMLPTAEVLTITTFHSEVQSMRYWMPRMGEDEKRRYEYGVQYVLYPVRDAFEAITPALRSIEKRLRINPPATLPDIKYVLQVIDMEDAEWEYYKEQQNNVIPMPKGQTDAA